MPEKYTRKPNTTCLVCSKPVYRRPFALVKSDGRIYCSLPCYGIASRKNTSCLVCGTQIMSSLRKKTCGRACSNTHRTGIKYKVGRPRDRIVLERSMKLRLFGERGSMCERCGYSKKEILQVHHKDGNHSNNKMDNLELICPNCHCEEHYLEKSWLKS